jgi:hypothetical protein
VQYRDDLFNTGFGFITTLFRKYGEFFPVAVVIRREDQEAAFLATETEEEQPASALVFEELKNAIREGAEKSDYLAGAIFYDCRITDPATNEKTDAVAVLYESADAATAELHFYPYHLSDQREPAFGEGYYEEQEKEMFL